ncbi:hypothetical protein [Roseobacter weihaiensis]|uniref:hypothetical protein n=1 Tax=Roseobacter weihaiensis TaxID=2763262 RepID=UPI001D0B11E9|nr:hypothetical protein [Roseobacter sp. H9]
MDRPSDRNAPRRERLFELLRQESRARSVAARENSRAFDQTRADHFDDLKEIAMQSLQTGT